MGSESLEEVVAKLAEKLGRCVGPGAHVGEPEPSDVWHAKSVADLHALAGEGRLAKVDALGHPLVDSLVAIATQPLWNFFAASGGCARALGELVRNIAEPGRITQGLKGSCAAATVEIYMVTHDPGEYARLVAGLLSREGRVTLRGGGEFVCDEDVLTPSVGERGRNAVSRVFQVACMEFAYPDLDYDNIADGQFKGDENVGTGIEMGPFEKLLVAITGEEWKTVSRGHAVMAEMFAKLGLPTAHVPNLARDGISIIEQVLSKGDDVFATLVLPSARSPDGASDETIAQHAEHKVLVVGLDRTASTIHFEDPIDPQRPWFDGADVQLEDRYGRCSMPIADFERLVDDISYRPALWERATPPE